MIWKVRVCFQVQAKLTLLTYYQSSEMHRLLQSLEKPNLSFPIHFVGYCQQVA